VRTLIVALQGLRGAPVKSILVVLALTLGMVGFVAVLTADQVMRDAVTQRAVLLGGNASTYQATIAVPPGDGEAGRAADQLERRLAATGAASIEDLDVGVWSDGAVMNDVAVVFTEPELRDILPFPLVEGSWLIDAVVLAPRVALNEAARDALGGAKLYEIGTQDQRVTFSRMGVVRDGRSTPQVYIHLDEYSRWNVSPSAVSIRLHSPTLSEDEVRMAARQLGAVGASFTLRDIARTDQVDLLADEIGTTTRVLFVLGLLSLASTVVGIANVGLATARSRAREFTLRRAMGASRSQLALIVIVESQILAGAAAVIAVAGSYALFPAVVGAFDAQLGVTPPPYQWHYALICLIVASATAIVSSIVPALLSYGRDLSGVMRE
jgi:putative ABC transport system permease protein